MEYSGTNKDVVDIQMILDQIGGDRSLLREVIKVFLTDGPNIREHLRESLEQKDLHQLREAAHSAKGAIGNFCTENAIRKAISLENACKNSETDNLPALTHALQEAISEVEEALHKSLDTL